MIQAKVAPLRLSKEEFARVKSYEEVYIELLRRLKKPAKKEAFRFIPQYLQDKLANPQLAAKVSDAEMLRQIKDCVTQELKFYRASDHKRPEPDSSDFEDEDSDTETYNHDCD